MRFQIALIGYGSIAEEHAKAFAAVGSPFGAVVGPDRAKAEAFATANAIPSSFASIAEVADAGMRAVVVASPTPLHAAQTEAALQGGLDVLCEIPVALSYRRASDLRGLAQKNGLLLAGAHTQRYMRSIRWARDAVSAGLVQPTHLVTTYMLRRRENVSWTGRPRSWVDDVLWHHGMHAIDTALYLLDEEATQILSLPSGIRGPVGQLMDLGALVRTGSGRLITVALSYNASIEANRHLLIGEKETYQVERDRVTGPGGLVFDVNGDISAKVLAMREQAQAFIRGIQARADIPSAIDHILPAMRVVDEVSNSLRDWGFPPDTADRSTS